MTLYTTVKFQGLRGITTVNIEFTVDGNSFSQIIGDIKTLKTEIETRYPKWVWNIQLPFHDLIFLDVDKPKKRK